MDTASDPPPDRWCLALDRAYSTDQAQPDRVHSRRACFVRDFQLDPQGIDLPSELIESLDPMVHLALHAGRQAWRDSVADAVDPARVGVMLGNIVLPTASASAMADWILGRSFERELFRAAGVPMPPETRAPVAAINRWVAGLPAAMLAKGLGLGGDRFCIDAACASSLFTVELAVDALRQGRLDAVLAGGLSRPDSLYTQMGFSQLLAVSPTGRCSPFDRKSDGLVVGEGAGVLVLKRLSDARRHGDRIRAVIHSVGLSNDVEGSLLAPSREGQLRAMRGAYQAAGVDAESGGRGRVPRDGHAGRRLRRVRKPPSTLDGGEVRTGPVCDRVSQVEYRPSAHRRRSRGTPEDGAGDGEPGSPTHRQFRRTRRQDRSGGQSISCARHCRTVEVPFRSSTPGGRKRIRLRGDQCPRASPRADRTDQRTVGRQCRGEASREEASREAASREERDRRGDRWDGELELVPGRTSSKSETG